MAEVQDIRVTVAPFYDTTARRFAAMPESERIAIRENFFHNAAFLAELCGLSFNPDIESQNVGGFENEHGKKLIEVSHTFSFPKSNKDKVDLFAALMAEFGYQAQESTISACYCDRTDEDYTTQEYTIYLSNLDSLAQIAQSCGVNNFTVNTLNKTISILAWEQEDIDNIENLIFKLKDYGYYKKDTNQSVNSRYLERSERTKLYKGWLQDRTGLSQMVMSEGQTREQHRGIPQMGIQEQRTGTRSIRHSEPQSSRTASEYQSQRLGLLCRAIGEAHRRLEERDYFLKKPDYFLRNLETEMLRGDNAELQALNAELNNRIISNEAEIIRLSKEKDDYRGKFHRVLNVPGALEEFRENELRIYKENVLEQICQNLNKTFSDRPFTGIDIEFQYPPYSDGKPLGNWSGHGEILSVTFLNGKGETRHWSQAKNTLDSTGNHVTSKGGIYNISTGEYKEPPRKIEKEWDETRKVLKKSSGIHR